MNAASSVLWEDMIVEVLPLESQEGKVDMLYIRLRALKMYI